MLYFDQYATVQDVLDLKAAQSPQRAKALAVPVSASLSELMNYMRDHNVGAIFIRNEMKDVIGLITERDLVSHLAFYEKRAFDLPIDQIIIRNIISCACEDALKAVAAEMAHHRIRHMAVKNDQGKYIGLISSSDIELFAGEG